jgi:hypothetical protein
MQLDQPTIYECERNLVFCCPPVALIQDQVEKMSKIPEGKSAYAGIGFASYRKRGTGVVFVETPWLNHITIQCFKQFRIAKSKNVPLFLLFRLNIIFKQNYIVLYLLYQAQIKFYLIIIPDHRNSRSKICQNSSSCGLFK